MSTTKTTSLNATQIGAKLSLDQSTVIALYKKGAIPAEIAEGRLYRFDLEKVKAALAERAARKESGK